MGFGFFLIRSIVSMSLLVPAQVLQPDAIPAATAIPVVFTSTVDAAKAKIGDPVIVKTNQVVKLASGVRIPNGAILTGHVVFGRARSRDGDSELGIRFEKLTIRHQTIEIRVHLRAMASFVDSYDVRSALVDYGTPDNSLFGQVGGDTYYPYDKVHSPKGAEVGQATRDGIFVKLSGTESGACEATDTLQSVGIFSSGACGLYGFYDFSLEKAGTDDDGVIQFHSQQHSAKIPRGTVALLQVERSPIEK